ncbi:MAG: prepilin-type N-terminal cleavage/methylation domain-containing protein [Pseudomonadota bacterium]
MGRDRRRRYLGTRGFTLVEVLIATALLGFSLVVMFGFHAQAARSNAEARKITACTYLAQARLEQLLALTWTQVSRPDELDGPTGDSTTTSDPWADLLHEDPVRPWVNAGNTDDTALGELIYRVTWAVEEMDSEPTWLRLRVRCTYYDQRFTTWRGTTISSFRYRDD